MSHKDRKKLALSDEVEKIDENNYQKKSDKTEVIVGAPESMSKSKKYYRS